MTPQWVHKVATQLYPDDGPPGYVPLAVDGDGNCFSHSASGDQNHPRELHYEVTLNGDDVNDCPWRFVPKWTTFWPMHALYITCHFASHEEGDMLFQMATFKCMTSNSRTLEVSLEKRNLGCPNKTCLCPDKAQVVQTACLDKWKYYLMP